MSREVTWKDCIQACDELIEILKLKMRDKPERGKIWQEALAVAMCKKQELQILAKQEEDAQFKKTLLNICNNVLDKSRKDGTI